jgi:hypothetical protein
MNRVIETYGDCARSECCRADRDRDQLLTLPAATSNHIGCQSFFSWKRRSSASPDSVPIQPAYGGRLVVNPLCTKVSRVLPLEFSSSQVAMPLSPQSTDIVRPGSSATILAAKTPGGKRLEAAHGKAPTHPRLDADRKAEPPAGLVGVDQRVVHVFQRRVDEELRPHLGRGEVTPGGEFAAFQMIGQIGQAECPEGVQDAADGGLGQRLLHVEVGLREGQDGRIRAFLLEFDVHGGVLAVGA